ncbi:MAG: metal-dependent phosphohydrolase [Dehalococcoidales bacterium]|nr:metal-dependent phosphohydrolase [Dehalococcoidales bacterium]
MIAVDEKDLKLVIEPAASLLLTKVSNFLTEHNVRWYVVGGFVRDMLLGRDTADIDIAVAADALEVAPKIAVALGGKYVPLDRVNRVGRVVLVNQGAPSTKDQWELDFSTFEGNVDPDLAQRDFTIDAMAFDLLQLKRDHIGVRLIDPFNGRNDLRQGVIRAVVETAFTSDAARLLRAVRLAAELGFRISPETETLLQRYSSLIAGVSGERVREELLRLLTVPRADLLPYLDRLGLLMAVIPELAQTKEVTQPKEHFWNVFDHSLKTVVAVDFLLRQGKWEYGNEEILATAPWSEVLAQHFALEVSSGSTRRSLLKLAALLHDIAKPRTKTIEAGGRMRFLGHTQDGASMAADVLERLRFSGKEVKLVEIMVRHHLRPMQMSQEKLPSRRAIYRYFRDTGETGIDILFLSLADHLATRGPHLSLTGWQEHADIVNYVLAQCFQEESLVTPPKLIDGHDLINIFGMSPGVKIGELLEVVREAQASGELATRDEALAYLRERLAKETE